jgi:hypothetical protein
MLVLDANVLVRAVLGSRALSLLREYSDRVEFVAPTQRFKKPASGCRRFWSGANCRRLPLLRPST